MKHLKLIILLAAIAVSCTNTTNDELQKIIDGKQDSYYMHFLFLSFQDNYGNDLVKGIEFNLMQPNAGPVTPNTYTLNALFPDGTPKPPIHDIMGFNDGKLFEDGFSRLSFSNSSYKEIYDARGNLVKYPFVENITYKLKCPYIFGDDEEHDIVTWWELKAQNDIGAQECALCCRIEFDGKIYTAINYLSNKNISEVTLIWESK